MRGHWSRALSKLSACAEAVRFAREHESLGAAWEACERGDWMLWLLARASATRREDLALATCACARLALKFVPASEKRPLECVETVERWAAGTATIEEVKTARRAAADAAAAAYAAADAAYAAADAAYAAYAAANAAYAAAYAADADANAARDKSLAGFCEAVVQILIEMNVPGVQWLALTEASQ